MKIQLLRHTGEFETVDIDGESVEREILETVREAEVKEASRGQLNRAYRLRAEMLTRDTGERHEVRTV